MNQILATNSQNPNNRPKKQKSQKPNIKYTPADSIVIIRIFAIILLIFGISIIGTGSYAIYRAENNQKGVAMVNPQISVQKVEGDETRLILTVTSSIGIDTVVYQWNDDKETTLQGDGGKYLEQKIQIPTGSNILKVTATDVQNQISTDSTRYELDSNIKIEATDEGKISVTCKKDTQIAYMTYRWDDGEEETIDIDADEVNEELDTLSGLHTLTVVIVDENNNAETSVKEISGISVPKINIELNEDQTKYIITVTDEIELQEVVVTLGEEDEAQKFGEKINGKEFTFEMPLKKNSDNKMLVEVKNSDNQTAEKRVYFRK